MKINVRPLFYLDISETVAHLAEKAGADIAVRWAESVWETVLELEARPHLGRERKDLPFPAVRSWRVRNYSRWLVFYGAKPAALVFYRVKHGAANLVTLDFDS